MRKILAITGIRSEYDLLYPIFDTLRNDPEFEVKFVVGGTHLSLWHGNSVCLIEKDGFEIVEKIDYLLKTDRPIKRANGAGNLIQSLAKVVEREQPEFLFVVGDREESIATAVIGNYMEVLVVHLAGGDTAYGNADDPIRFATSKLAHIHLTFSQKSADNLKRVGEEEFRIFNVGNPALDRIRMVPEHTLRELSDSFGFDIGDGNYVVLLQHPLSSEREDAGRQMVVTLQALEQFCAESHYKVIAIYPNTDPGARGIVDVLASYEGKTFIKFYRNLDRDIFVNVMRNAKALVGNSSMGILEAPFYKLPVVNVGNRQKGREQAGNVEFVPHEKGAITQAIHKACTDEQYRRKVAELKNPFGNGRASEKIKDVLRSIDLSDRKWIIKKNLAGPSL